MTFWTFDSCCDGNSQNESWLLLKLWISFHSPFLLPFISTLITKIHNQMKFITRIHSMWLALKRARLSLCHSWLPSSIWRGYCRFAMILILFTLNHIVFVVKADMHKLDAGSFRSHLCWVWYLYSAQFVMNVCFPWKTLQNNYPAAIFFMNSVSSNGSVATFLVQCAETTV